MSAQTTNAEHIKDCVKRIIEKEAALLQNSPIWQMCSDLLSYMLDLSPKHLRNVRIHTDIFTGESLNTALFSGMHQKNPTSYAENLGYTFAAEDLPKEYWLSEPPIDNWFGNGTFGCRYDDVIINIELSRYQLYMENFIATGMVDNIKSSPTKKVVMEIGAGYGALGYHLIRLTNNKVCYVVLDLPLMLLYTGYYIAAHHPEAKMFIYDPDNPAHQNLDDTITQYDVVLIPNHRLSILKNVTRVDYAINNISMAEMTDIQVQDYINFIKPRLTNYFYFQNYAWDYEKPIHLFVGEHFNAKPSLDFYDHYIKNTGQSVAFPAKTFFYTASKEADDRLAPCQIKLRLPDNRLAKLSLGNECISIRKSPGNYVPFIPKFWHKIVGKLGIGKRLIKLGKSFLRSIPA